MNLQDLINYFNRSNTDVLGSLPSMLGTPVSPSPIPNSDNADYDMVGFNLSNGSKGSNGHYTDEFKLPNHTTFSNESKYSGGLFEGGKWMKAGSKDVFHPSLFNYMLNTPIQLSSHLANEGSKLYGKIPKTIGDLVDLNTYRTNYMPSNLDEKVLSTARAFMAQEGEPSPDGRVRENDWSNSEIDSLNRATLSDDFIDPYLYDLTSAQRNNMYQLVRYLSKYSDNGINQALYKQKSHSE